MERPSRGGVDAADVYVGVGNAVGRVQRVPRGVAGRDGLIDAAGTKQFREKKPLPRHHAASSLNCSLP